MGFRQINRVFFTVLLFGVVLFVPVVSWATHLRAGEITVTRVSCTSREFEICITVYTNTESQILFGGGDLNFGDGSKILVTPETKHKDRPDLGPNIGIVTYCVRHTYSGPGRYVISYGERNRNAGILNVFNSVETKFYIETVINIDPLLGCSNSPRLLVPPIDKACTGAAWYHNPGAYDPDGDSLSFEMVIPLKDKGQLVNGYRPPNAKEFYSGAGIDYATANEDQDSTPTFSINATTGTIIWDAPGAAGQYNISFLIKEWRKIGDAWIQLGHVTRDMQIVVEDCANKRPELKVPPDICVEAGTIISEDIFATDPDQDSVKIEAFSQVFGVNPSPATWLPNPAKYQSTAGLKQGKLKFIWATRCEHIKDQPYQVVFKVTDNPPKGKGAKLVQFKTWNIRVVAPAPKWKDAQIDLAKRSAKLVWKNYLCTNAEIMQVWRRVDRFVFDPSKCVTGMPDFLGFTKIAEVPIATTQYTDVNGGKGLAVGAAYCYRLVAIFPLPGGGKSYVSKDTCLAPIKADAPVITNVTIDKTNQSTGQVTVKWRSPFDINKGQFPPPYKYEVYRSEGFSGVIGRKKARSLSVDSVFVDTNLNTEEKIYNYTIIAYDNNNISVDTSFSASTVRLEAKPKVKQVELAWNAIVPWSNKSQDFPRHLIYRGSAGATVDQLVLIDSINVNEKKFHYIDSGQYNKTALKETELYCYRVMTKGVYGNPKIKEPLKNFSQIICAQPNDSTPPCAPVFAVDLKGIDCTNYDKNNTCGQNLFSNVIYWNRSTDPVCRADVKSYNIYVANTVADTFSLYVQNVRDTFFIDANLPSFARCYKIAAVDRSGNISRPLSEKFCFDNCPKYELPNVFTPNGDECNELFSAYSDRTPVDEFGNTPCGKISDEDSRNKCARFVEKVKFVVVNRWGKEVYSYESGGERTIYIDWDGRDNGGKELSTGVYFYQANVTFNVVDPSQKQKVIKGWVHLIR